MKLLSGEAPLMVDLKLDVMVIKLDPGWMVTLNYLVDLHANKHIFYIT